MRVKNRKAAIFFSTATIAVVLLDVILPNASRSNTDMHDFIRGLMTGMGIVTAVVWLVFLVISLTKQYRADGAVILNKDKNILLGITMPLILIVAVAAIYFTNNILVSAACFVTVASSYLLNFLYIKRRGKSACQG